MFSLVDYQISDDENDDREKDFDQEINCNAMDNERETCKYEDKSKLDSKVDKLLKIKNFKKNHQLKVDFFDEDYYMNLESEYASESVKDTDFVKQEKKQSLNKSHIGLNIPEPKFTKSVVPIDFNTNNFDDWYDDEINTTDPSTINLNLIKPDEKEEIPTEFLKSGNLLTVSERANLKRKYNVDIDTITVKKVSMDDLTSDRPLEVRPTLTQEEISRFKSLKEEQPDKNSSRQHQITWLAHKAKEREFELQNSLAENTFNQNQSRSKYGF